jgi:signal transduction histidine kinase
VLTLFNQATREIHGLPELPLPADRWAEHYDLFLADGKTRMGKEQIPLFRALQGERLRDFEMTVVPHGGAPRRILASGRPIIDASGRKLGAVVALNDVTEHRQLEEQYRQAQKLEAVGRLAGGVAHDFNNLLSVILGYGDLCLQDAPAAGRLRERIESIRSAAQRATTLTRQLLTFSRKQVVELQVVDPNGLLVETTRMLRRLIGEDIQIVVRPAEGLGRIQADPGQIEQIVMNLAVNARDAMPQGGTLTFETASVDLDEAYARRHPGADAGPHVRLAITDTGVGMSAEVQGRIFEPFFTTKEPGKGTGLGLATVYGIVRQGGGHIEVDSAPGRGTSFQVFWPRIDAPVASVSQPEAAGAPNGTETILVVEDERAVRELVLETLALYGYKAIGAANATEALGLSARCRGVVHLLITDLVLPGMGGRELARLLTAQSPELRVLYTSGYADEVGPAFIQKPFALTALARKVREVLDAPSLKPV